MPALTVAFWNLQNLFDTTESDIAADLEFTPAEGWTDAALEQKLTNLASVIDLMHNSNGPDLLGVCEVENKAVLQRLIDKCNRTDYKIAHIESPDIRGIDTSLVYSKDKFELIGDPIPHNIHLRFPTRDIFEVLLKVKGTNTHLLVLVNHWPSRSQGQYESEPYRIAVAHSCGKIVDSYLKMPREQFLLLPDDPASLDQLNELWNRNILLMGDFNDEPFNRSILQELGASSGEDKIEEPIKKSAGKEIPAAKSYLRLESYFLNYMWPFMGTPDTGTYYFSGSVNSMNLLDQFIASRGLHFAKSGLRVKPGSVEIFTPNIMWTSASNRRPKAFDKVTSKGYSDHFPIQMVLETV